MLARGVGRSRQRRHGHGVRRGRRDLRGRLEHRRADRRATAARGERERRGHRGRAEQHRSGFITRRTMYPYLLIAGWRSPGHDRRAAGARSCRRPGPSGRARRAAGVDRWADNTGELRRSPHLLAHASAAAAKVWWRNRHARAVGSALDEGHARARLHPRARLRPRCRGARAGERRRFGRVEHTHLRPGQLPPRADRGAQDPDRRSCDLLGAAPHPPGMPGGGLGRAAELAVDGTEQRGDRRDGHHRDGPRPALDPRIHPHRGRPALEQRLADERGALLRRQAEDADLAAAARCVRGHPQLGGQRLQAAARLDHRVRRPLHALVGRARRTAGGRSRAPRAPAIARSRAPAANAKAGSPTSKRARSKTGGGS